MPESADRRLRWYSQMLHIRVFEEKVQELFMSGQIQGTTHLCNGQEAVSVGAVSVMRPGDVQTNTYRGHGEALALGMEPEVAFAELMGRSSGGSKGLGGSMHLIDTSKGNIGANAIVGAGLPIAVGASMAFKLRKEPYIALTFFGDGATNIGTFHEALNMAALWKAPVVFIVVNNLYGEYSPLSSTTAGGTDLARRADGYGIPGVVVDGQDIDVVHAEVSRAVERARAGDGPTLLEMKTYRYRGRLAEAGILSADEQAALRAEIVAEVDAAGQRATDAPYPTLEETRSYVYAD
jgi:TPP-dependent pyruvate/acetoin dehydrogenase alpha subunit